MPPNSSVRKMWCPAGPAKHMPSSIHMWLVQMKLSEHIDREDHFRDRTAFLLHLANVSSSNNNNGSIGRRGAENIGGTGRPVIKIAQCRQAVPVVRNDRRRAASGISGRHSNLYNPSVPHRVLVMADATKHYWLFSIEPNGRDIGRR